MTHCTVVRSAPRSFSIAGSATLKRGEVVGDHQHGERHGAQAENLRPAERVGPRRLLSPGQIPISTIALLPAHPPRSTWRGNLPHRSGTAAKDGNRPMKGAPHRLWPQPTDRRSFARALRRSVTLTATFLLPFSRQCGTLGHGIGWSPSWPPGSSQGPDLHADDLLRVVQSQADWLLRSTAGSAELDLAQPDRGGIEDVGGAMKRAVRKRIRDDHRAPAETGALSRERAPRRLARHHPHPAGEAARHADANPAPRGRGRAGRALRGRAWPCRRCVSRSWRGHPAADAMPRTCRYTLDQITGAWLPR